jgi:hypothetical protein
VKSVTKVTLRGGPLDGHVLDAARGGGGHSVWVHGAKIHATKGVYTVDADRGEATYEAKL